MKLFAAIAPLALASVRKPCPNDKWRYDVEKGCNPVGVEVKCNPTTMSVEFFPEHIFAHGHTGAIQGGSDRAQLINPGNDPECQLEWNASSGTYKAEWDLEKCGGSVTQRDDGFIMVSNKIQGVSYQSSKFNLFTTSTLSFNAVCGYENTYTPSTFFKVIETEYTGSVENYGKFGMEMICFCDADFQKRIDSTTVLGEKIFCGIRSIARLPNFVDYFVTSCAASDTESDNSINLIENQCLLQNPLTVDTPFNPTWGGRASLAQGTYGSKHWRGLQYSFDAFSFAENGSQMDVSCEVKVCAIDAAGNKVNPNCAKAAACADCATDYYRPSQYCAVPLAPPTTDTDINQATLTLLTHTTIDNGVTTVKEVCKIGYNKDVAGSGTEVDLDTCRDAGIQAQSSYVMTVSANPPVTNDSFTTSTVEVVKTTSTCHDSAGNEVDMSFCDQ